MSFRRALPFLALLLMGCGPKGECAEGFGLNADGNCLPLESAGDTGAEDSRADTGTDTATDSAADTETGTDTASPTDADEDGYTADADCDDLDPLVNPGAHEDCGTTHDDNCNGETNEPESTGCRSFYVDDDDDGFGGAGSACLCVPDAAYSADEEGDCDDSDAAINPTATEVCENGADDDCDGDTAECRLSDRALGAADVVFAGEVADDRAGSALSRAGDVNGDGYDDVLIAAVWADAPSEDGSTSYSYSGAVYLVHGGPSMGGTIRLSDADASWRSQVYNSLVGYAVAGGEDFDGDGYPDIAIGAATYNEGTAEGAVCVVGGGPSLVSGGLSFSAGCYVDAGDGVGDALAFAGDVNGDGLADLIAGMGLNGGHNGARLIFGESGALSGELGVDVELLAVADNENLGDAVSTAGDVNGDGLDDVLMGDPFRADSQGSVYLFLGAAALASDTVDNADYSMTGESSNANAGFALGGGGDIDGDGYSDVIVGALTDSEGGSEAGAAYVIRASELTPALSLGDVVAKWTGTESDEAAGAAVAVAEDVDGNGRADVMIGAWAYNAAGPGRAYYLSDVIALSGGSLGSSDATFTGEVDGDKAGGAVGGAGDVNQDGFGDLLVGAMFADGAAEGSGAAYLVFGTGE